MENNKETDAFVVYVLEDPIRGWTYIGSTADLDRRILQHNGVYGRAQATKQTWGHSWIVAGFMSGFRTRPQALSFEYKWRRCCKRARSLTPLERRMDGLKRLLQTGNGHQKWEGDGHSQLEWQPQPPLAGTESAIKPLIPPPPPRQPSS